MGAEDTEDFRAHKSQRACRGTDCFLFDSLWATGATCRVCGALPRESCAAAGDVLPGPDLGFRVTEGLYSGPVAGADFTRGPHPNRLSFPAHAGNRRKGAFCKCLS